MEIGFKSYCYTSICWAKIIFKSFSPYKAQQIEVRLWAIKTKFNSRLADTPFYFSRTLSLKHKQIIAFETKSELKDFLLSTVTYIYTVFMI